MDPGSQGSRSGNLRFPGLPNVRDDRRGERPELPVQDISSPPGTEPIHHPARGGEQLGVIAGPPNKLNSDR